MLYKINQLFNKKRNDIKSIIDNFKNRRIRHLRSLTTRHRQYLDYDPVQSTKKRYYYLLGNTYYFYKRAREWQRVRRYNNITDWLTFSLFFIKFKSLEKISRLLITVSILLISVVIDYFLNKHIWDIKSILNIDKISFWLWVINSNTSINATIVKLLGIYIANIFVIVWVIVTVFSIGISQTKLPQTVKEYVYSIIINNIFWWYIVVWIYLLSLIILAEVIIPFSLWFSRGVATIYTIWILLDLWKLLYKFLIKNQTTNILIELFKSVAKLTNIPSMQKKYWRESHSIMISARLKTKDTLGIQFSLMEFLLKDINSDNIDIEYIFFILVEELRDYISKKKYIDRSFWWRFPTIKRKVTNNDSSLLSLKQEIESLWIGSYYTDEENYDRFENNMIYYLEALYNICKTSSNLEHKKSLIEQLAFLIVGDEKRVWLYNSQSSFLIKILKMFQDLKQNLEEALFVFYWNHYLRISLVVLKSNMFEEDLQTISKIVSWWYRNKYSIDSIKWNETYNILREYMKKISLEKEVESIFITPKDYLISLINKELNIYNKQQQKDLMEGIFKDQSDFFNILVNKKQYFQAVFILKIIINNITNILNNIDINKDSLKDILYNCLPENAAIPFLLLNTEDLIELDIITQLEICIFKSIDLWIRDLFESLLYIMCYHIIALQEFYKDSSIEYIRLVLIIGGYLYLDAELNQNYSFLNKYIEIIEERIFKKWYMLKVLDICKSSEFKNIRIEVHKYSHMFQNKMQQLFIQKDYSPLSAYWSYNEEEIDHISAFIRKLSIYNFNIQEECIEWFYWFLEKREYIKKLIYLLKKINA